MTMQPRNIRLPLNCARLSQPERLSRLMRRFLFQTIHDLAIMLDQMRAGKFFLVILASVNS